MDFRVIMPDPATTCEIVELVAAHHRELYGYAYRLTGSSHDAEDLVQQTFLVAQEKLPQLRDSGAARSWLFAVLRNLFCKERRRHSPIGEGLLALPLEEVPQPGWEESPLDGELLQQALEELPEEFRVAIGMFYFEQLSYKQMAEQLEVPIGTVMSRLSRAKQHLRRRMLAAEPTGVLAGDQPKQP